MASREYQEGILSLLDTDLYKLTMQCCVLKYFADIDVTYELTNRTSHMRLNYNAFLWLQAHVKALENVRLTTSEVDYLRKTCPYFTATYLEFLASFQFRPEEQVELLFRAIPEDGDKGDVKLRVKGKWVETILYEIPLLALFSEAYFKFCDCDWDYEGQVEGARAKAAALLENGCFFSEFGTRRRRDYHTLDLVLQGLILEQKESERKSWPGKFSGSSNVHFAMKYNLQPVGTVAHEWVMGIAAITEDYKNANELAVRYWLENFGYGVLSIALTDTFGTPTFLKAFRQPIHSLPIKNGTDENSMSSLDTIKNTPTFAKVFTGIRQDSGDPFVFINTMRRFYDEEGITEKKVIVFSDSLDINKCLAYKKAAEEKDFQPVFGVGTFLSNDFVHRSTSKKSEPLNIVIKMSSAAGKAAVKISDSTGKNMGDRTTVAEVKQILEYDENCIG